MDVVEGKLQRESVCVFVSVWRKQSTPVRKGNGQVLLALEAPMNPLSPPANPF